MTENPDMMTLLLLMACVIFAIIAGAALRWLAAHTDIGAKDYSQMSPDEIVIIARSIDSETAHQWQAVIKDH